MLDFFEKSDELMEVQSLCLKKLELMKILDILGMPKFKNLQPNIQSIIINLSAKYNPKKEEKKEEVFNPYDDDMISSYSEMDLSEGEEQEEEEC